MINMYINNPKENWIIDRLRKDFKNYCAEHKAIGILPLNTPEPFVDVVWLIASWCWRQEDLSYLKEKKVIATISHIDLDKFCLEEFRKMDEYVDIYHVICTGTHDILRQFTDKKIITDHWWYNPKIDEFKKKASDKKASVEAKAIQKRQEIAKSFGLRHPKFIGSFQRDTEGFDLKSPKKSKGPDIFVDKVVQLSQVQDVIVLLAGWRRQYVIKRLKEHGIPFVYHEMASEEQMIWLYLYTNLYIVSSRIEGGPQAILECAALNVPIISTDVGIARDILHQDYLYQPQDNIVPISSRDYLNINLDHNSQMAAVYNISYTIPKMVQKFLEALELT